MCVGKSTKAVGGISTKAVGGMCGYLWKIPKTEWGYERSPKRVGVVKLKKVGGHERWGKVGKTVGVF